STPTIRSAGCRITSEMTHEHPTTVASEHRSRLLAVFGVTVALLTAEIVGGVLGHSLALIADAGHMATDAAAIGLSLLAVWFASRAPNDARTFGFQRAEIIAAVLNATLLF